MKQKMKVTAILAAIFLLAFSTAAFAAMDKKAIKPEPQTAGGVTLSATMVPFAPPQIVDGPFGIPGMLWTDGKIVTMKKGGIIEAWNLADNKLTPDKTAFSGQAVKADGKSLSGTGKGIFYTDPFFGVIAIDIKKGIVADAGKVQDNNMQSGGELAVDPTCNWGLLSFMGNDVMKVDLAKLSANKPGAYTPFPALCNLKNDKRKTIIDNIKRIYIGKNRIYVGGGITKKALKKDNFAEGVAVLDYSGKVLGSYNSDGAKFNAGKIGWTHGFIETKDGFAVLDGNLRTIFLFSKDAKYKGEVSLSSLLGLNYCWPTAIQRVNGTVMLMTTQEFNMPGGKKQTEAFAWKIKGL